jgi:Mu-like prophage I protein
VPAAPLTKVLLSWPTAITLQDEVQGSPRRSWAQVAKTGEFVSSRYGKFSITRDDLSEMLHNFKHVTPAAPTELPVDYDHLSMDPDKPGDGIAAGWFKDLQLRENGDELWASVEWTPAAAKSIENKEYRFVSPSFVKDHTHKDGKKIGTTLLAAAITNHPFLEGMAALTLYNFSTVGELATLKEKVGDLAAPVLLSEIGQRVMIAPGNARTQDEVGGTFEITEVVGDGEDAFVAIKDANGVPHKWFRATELLPASATPANPIQQNLQPAPGTPAPGAPAATQPGAAPAAAAAADPTHEEVAKQLETAKAAEEAAAAASPAAPPEPQKTVTAPQPGDKPDVEELIKRKVAAALAAGTHLKRTENMMFKLRNDKNEEFEVSAEQLAAAGIKIVPDGSEAIPSADLKTLKDSVTSLSTRVETLVTENATTRAAAAKIELTSELNRLSKAGLITKSTRDELEKQFANATDLTLFKALAATFTTPVVVLNTEHGSGGKPEEVKDPGTEAENKIIALGNTIAKERGISLREAYIAAGTQLQKEAEAYREKYSGQPVPA